MPVPFGGTSAWPAMPAITAKRMQNSVTEEANLQITPSQSVAGTAEPMRPSVARPWATTRPSTGKSARHNQAGRISCQDNVPSIFYRFADGLHYGVATDTSQIARDAGFLSPISGELPGERRQFAAISRHAPVPTQD
jgi:hypothetical protein